MIISDACDAALTTTVIIDALLRFSNSSNPRLSNLAQIYLSVSELLLLAVLLLVSDSIAECSNVIVTYK